MQLDMHAVNLDYERYGSGQMVYHLPARLPTRQIQRL
jgi:hypothetical protein